MNNKCKYLKQGFYGKITCKKTHKSIVISDCKKCNYKEYDTTLIYNKERKNKKRISTRTKALDIDKKTKLIVWERDGQECIFCHCWVPWNLANSHFIKRSQGGLGIPENIFCACLTCHHDFDDTPKRKDLLPIAEEHLRKCYEDWSIDDLYYKK